jgi:plasmid stability protein
MARDETEPTRRILAAVINSSTEDEVREAAEQTWTTEELTRDFTVLGYSAPVCVVRRKSDGVRGSLMFKHSPRIYFNFVPEDQ